MHLFIDSIVYTYCIMFRLYSALKYSIICAVTCSLQTVFHFTIVPKFFKKALDMLVCFIQTAHHVITLLVLCYRFAHFFASPLLLDSSLDREIEAVDSGENTNTQLDSNWKSHSITPTLILYWKRA